MAAQPGQSGPLVNARAEERSRTAEKKYYLSALPWLKSIGGNILDEYGHTLLSIAAENGYRWMVEQLLYHWNADIDGKDIDGCSPLLYTAIANRKRMVEFLLQEGADIESRDNRGQTALVVAAAEGREQIVELLLQKGAVIESRTNYGYTALLWAATEGHIQVVELLLQWGAKIETRDNDGQTPLCWAARNGHKQVVELLLQQGREWVAQSINILDAISCKL